MPTPVTWQRGHRARIRRRRLGHRDGGLPLLQIRKIVQHRSSRGVSLGYMSVLFVGFLLWLAYGIALENWALILPNVIAALVIVATMAVALRYRRP